MSAPVLAGILAMTGAGDVLRLAFGEAQRRRVALRIVAAGMVADDEPLLTDLVERWVEKFPEVPAGIEFRDSLDPAITLTAATRTCCLAVLNAPDDPRDIAVVRAVQRRAACPLAVV
ncbi:hypothetical protein [Paractinoplanes durhamensis]|uniref:Uncharacterized protein n=1 Tax=Paractinoplanes durhamensis TaxID=113563 RepID=A0ABQ3YRS4_9ACTN|nr:hypothetical protein [Actinoplanes durhamensis]GIE00246.1 hypothetical protein Adu01nite_15960 [Actinoplanes durhamensis]